MNNFKKFFKHLHTVNTHRRYVRHWCFKMGIPFRGLVHDLSKYSPKEFSIYKFYDGTRSPHEVAREQLGYSPSWLYHKAKNKHHWEYWLDNNGDTNFVPIKIPYKYVIEMFCDFVGAGKAYLKDKWTPSSPLRYFEKEAPNRLYHEDTYILLKYLFTRLSEFGVDDFLAEYKDTKKELKFVYKRGKQLLKNFLESSDSEREVLLVEQCGKS